MALLGRIVMVIVAYLLACMAASLVLAIGTVTPQWDALASLGVPAAALWLVVCVGAAIIAGIAMLPALLVIALTEGFGWRSIVLYGAAGGVLALALCYGIDFARYFGASGGFVAHEQEVLAASGIAGGLVYWLFAGRRAGAWKA